MSRFHRIIIIWMMAVTIHLPFPVCDGDDLRSGELHELAGPEDIVPIDIDLILLGCVPPDDVDDGPLDDDPEGGSSFGADFTTRTLRSGKSPGDSSPLPGHQEDCRAQSAIPGAHAIVFYPPPDSFASSGTIGSQRRVVLRC